MLGNSLFIFIVIKKSHYVHVQNSCVSHVTEGHLHFQLGIIVNNVMNIFVHMCC